MLCLSPWSQTLFEVAIFLFNFKKYYQTLKAKNNNITLKVRWNRNVFLGSSILPKNELENFNFCPGLLGQKFFVRFLEELKTQKSPFEINWPLVNACMHSMINVVWILNIMTEVIPRFHKFLWHPRHFFLLLFGSKCTLYIKIKMQFHKTNGPIVSFCRVPALTKPFIQPFHHSKIKALAQGVLIR